MRNAVLVFSIIAVASNAALASVFTDDFENDAVGAFPSQWRHFTPANSDVAVVNEAMYPGSVSNGNQALRIQFNGGYGSGVEVVFEPVSKGVMTFYSLFDHTTDRIVYTLNQEVNTDTPTTSVAGIGIYSNRPTYYFNKKDTGLAIVYGEYVKFDIAFDSATDLASLWINDQPVMTDIAFSNQADSVVAFSSRDVSDPSGSALWYLDDVVITPEPSAALLLGVASVTIMLRRRRIR